MVKLRSILLLVTLPSVRQAKDWHVLSCIVSVDSFPSNQIIHEMMLWFGSFCITVEFLFTRAPCTKMLIAFGTPRTIHALSRLKLGAWQISKVRARSHYWDDKWAMYEFELRKHWQKALTTDQKTTFDAEARTSDVERIVQKGRTSKMRENNMQLNIEDTQRSDLTCKFLSVNLVLIYLGSFIPCYCVH